MRTFINKNRPWIWGVIAIISVLATISDVRSHQFTGINPFLGISLIVFSSLGFVISLVRSIVMSRAKV